MSGNEQDNHAAIVILGAGYAGLMAALGLSGKKNLGRIVLISGRHEFVERIRLQESVAREVAGRLPPLAEFLAGSGIEFLQGTVRSLDPAANRVVVDCGGGTSAI